jgi:hypothetical protein
MNGLGLVIGGTQQPTVYRRRRSCIHAAPRCSGTRCVFSVRPFAPGSGIVRYHSPGDPIGLHLNFELHLPASTTRESVVASLSALHAFAQTLPFAELSPLLTDHDSQSEHAEPLSALRWWAELMVIPFNPDDALLAADASSAHGFLVQPGKGCETATFGLMRRTSATGTPVDWYWQCSCKTQYASTVSDAHLIACHTSLVRLLDHAMTLGLHVVVHDETHYWESRDDSKLVAEVRGMSQLVARIAGQLSDALGDAKGLQAPIFEHPRFERLEMGEDE